MSKLTQEQKIWILAFIAALGSVITDEEWAELAGLTRNPFMQRKARAKALLKKILMEESK